MTSQKGKAQGALRGDQQKLLREGFSFSGYERDPFYLNLEGRTFLDVSGISGIDSITDGRASVFADFDDDGDLDVFVTTIQGPSHLLFRNDVGQDRGSIRVALTGVASGRDAFGAVVRLKTSQGIQTMVKTGGEGFISQHDPRLLFGIGDDPEAAWMDVAWPSGATDRIEHVAAGTSLHLTEGRGAERVTERKRQLPDPIGATERLTKRLKLRVGQSFPSLPLRWLGGRTAPISAEVPKGGKLLVNLWATWCVPCAREMPALERMAGELRESNVAIAGISLDSDRALVEKYVRERRVTYPIAVGGQDALDAIYATEEATVPLNIMLDRNGRIEEIWEGFDDETRAAILEAASAKP